MNRTSPVPSHTEQPPPPEPDDSESWRELEAELLGAKTPESREAAEREMRAKEMDVRRREMLERVFEFSDLLVHAPEDFPDKKYLEHLAAAAAKMLNRSFTRKLATRIAVEELEAALTIVKAEKEAIRRGEDRAYEESQGRLREESGGDEPLE